MAVLCSNLYPVSHRNRVISWDSGARAAPTTENGPHPVRRSVYDIGVVGGWRVAGTLRVWWVYLTGRLLPYKSERWEMLLVGGRFRGSSENHAHGHFQASSPCLVQHMALTVSEVLERKVDFP